MAASTADEQHPTKNSAQETLDELLESTELWTVNDIAAFFGVGRGAVWHWERGCRNYQSGGCTAWPPTQQELRHRHPTTDAARRIWWPDYPTILPPPDAPSEHGRNRWFKRTVMLWGLRTKRIALTGEPLALKAGTRSRGRATGRGAADAVG